MVLADGQPPSFYFVEPRPPSWYFGAHSRSTEFRANVPAARRGARGLWTFHRACYARLISGSPPGWRAVRPEPMFVRQTSGHYSREKGGIIVRHYPYFFTISQQKAGKRNFHTKYFLPLMDLHPPQ